MANLKQVDCAPECGFRVRSHDENEIVNIVSAHARSAHGKTLSAADVRGMERPA